MVRAVGDALGLRDATPAFDATRLQAWAADPAGAFLAALVAPPPAAMQAIADAFRPVLPAGAHVTFTTPVLTLTLNELTLAWQTAPLSITLTGAFTGLPQVRRLDASITLDAGGLEALEDHAGSRRHRCGGGVRLRPILTIAAGDHPDGGRRVDLGLSGDANATRGFVARWNLGGPFALVTLPDGIQ